MTRKKAQVQVPVASGSSPMLSSTLHRSPSVRPLLPQLFSLPHRRLLASRIKSRLLRTPLLPRLLLRKLLKNRNV